MKWDFSSEFQINATLVPNRFIDECMAGASGEYVKIYLYLLRHREEMPDEAQTAEALHCTEGDVRRAIAYWQKVGVLSQGQQEAGQGRQASGQGQYAPDAGQQPSGLGQSAHGQAGGEKQPSSPVPHQTTAAPRPAAVSGEAALTNRSAGQAGVPGQIVVSGQPSVCAQTAGVGQAAAPGQLSAPAQAAGYGQRNTSAQLAGYGQPNTPAQPTAYAHPNQPIKPNPTAQARTSQDYSMENISRLTADEDFSQLLYIAQKYMNKVFTQRECQVFGYLYDELRLPAELLEYLVEYCVQNGHTSIRYMETVALNWHQKGLLTLEAARAYSAGFQKDYFAVMKAFGLTDRRPADTEKRLMENWFNTWGFSREVVLEACNRTIAATHSPSFQYADKILSEWKKAGVKKLSDVEELDMIRRSQEKNRNGGRSEGKNGSHGDGRNEGGEGAKSSRTRSSNRFHNFQQSATDYDSLMMEKVRARMKE